MRNGRGRERAEETPARQQHALLTVWPRVNRRDSKLNERLLPLYDDTGRLFFASDSPVPEDLDYLLKQEKQDLDCGVRTVNEIRSERGLKPVSWGDEPWLPLTWAPASLKRRADYAPQTGRNADPDRNVA